jgi:hypothetical protein
MDWIIYSLEEKLFVAVSFIFYDMHVTGIFACRHGETVIIWDCLLMCGPVARTAKFIGWETRLPPVGTAASTGI